MVTIGVTAEPLPISPIQLITPGASITGHPSGTARDVEETMQFAVLSGVRAWIEQRPLAEKPPTPTRRWSKDNRAIASC